MGIGGSATNDGGFGLARALGWEFLDREGQLIERWTGLERLGRILAPRRRRWFARCLVATDVRIPCSAREARLVSMGRRKVCAGGNLRRQSAASAAWRESSASNSGATWRVSRARAPRAGWVSDCGISGHGVAAGV